MAQDREKQLSDKMLEAKYLRQLMEGTLDITLPDMSSSQISLNLDSVLKNVHAVMDPEQQHVSLVFTGIDNANETFQMQSKIRLFQSDMSLNISKKPSQLIDDSLQQLQDNELTGNDMMQDIMNHEQDEDDLENIRRQQSNFNFSPDNDIVDEHDQ